MDPAAGLSREARLRRTSAAFADLDAPFAFVDLDAMWANSADMLRRAAGKPIRVASKSLRCRELLRSVLERDAGYRGLLCFTLPEALWLAREGFEDLVVAYPSTGRRALRELAERTARDSSGAPVVMVDSVEHLDLIDAAVGPVSARSASASTSTRRTGSRAGACGSAPSALPSTPRSRPASWRRGSRRGRR